MKKELLKAVTVISIMLVAVGFLYFWRYVTMPALTKAFPIITNETQTLLMIVGVIGLGLLLCGLWLAWLTDKVNKLTRTKSMKETPDSRGIGSRVSCRKPDRKPGAGESG